MPATRNLQASAQWALPLLDYTPITIAGPDPALTSANLTKQAILGAPFCWRWNRSVATFQCVVGTQDYSLPVRDIGFIEKVTLYDAAAKKQWPVKNEGALGAESNTQRPQSGTLQGEDSSGALTYRFNTPPDVAYLATIIYQRRAVPMTSMACTWGPIPDELAHIYDWGFLANLSIHTRDSRWPVFQQRFVAHLLGAQDGLEAMQRNIFLGNFIDAQLAQQRATMGVQQGMGARGQ